MAVGPQPNVQLHEGVNLDGADNYVALEASGAGQMIGLLRHGGLSPRLT